MATKTEYLAALGARVTIVGTPTAMAMVGDWQVYTTQVLEEVGRQLIRKKWSFAVKDEGQGAPDEVTLDYGNENLPSGIDMAFAEDMVDALDGNYDTGVGGVPFKGCMFLWFSGRYRSCIFMALETVTGPPLTFVPHYYYGRKPEGGSLELGEIPTFDPSKLPLNASYGVPRL